MHQRKNTGASHRKQRHGLRKSVNRVTPCLPKQRKDRRDQRSGMTDTDPPDKVHDGEAPPDRDIDAPNPSTFNEQIAERDHQHVHQREHDQETEDPSQRDGPL